MKLGICGLGLIGSSVARAVAADHVVLGLDPDDNAAAVAADLGVDMVGTLAAMSDCDLILLCAPTAVNVALLEHLMEAGIRVPTADLGSVKGPILRSWVNDRSFPFVATHPMAGSERAGVAAGTADLFVGSAWPAVVEADTDPAVLERMVDLAVRLGAHVVPVSAPAHDRAIALVSHLPHVLAGALGDVVAADDRRDLAVRLAAGSFRDGTRVNASPPQRTAEFIAANGHEAAEAVRAAAARLHEAAAALEAGDLGSLTAWLGPAHQVREQWQVPTDDRPRRLPLAGVSALRDLLFAQRDTGLTVVGVSGDDVVVLGGSR